MNIVTEKTSKWFETNSLILNFNKTHYMQFMTIPKLAALYISYKANTVGPRFTNAPVYEQFGLRTNFPSKKCFGLRTVSRITNTIWQQRQTESISAGVSCW
jgi:hypothetical protein